MFAAAFFANAHNDHPMRGRGETILPGDGLPDLDQGVCVELEELVANLAVQMIVFGIAVLMLVHIAIL